MKSVVSQKPWLKDPLAVRKQWNEEEYGLVEHGHGKNLCFGILWDDGDVMPHPPIRRGLEAAKQALIAAGHKGKDSFLLFCNFFMFVIVIDWKPFKHMEIFKAVVSTPSRFNVIIFRFSYYFFQLQMAIWSAGAKEDYRVATLLSGEPVISTMNLAIDNPDLAENVPAFRLLPDGISAYELWQVQKLKRDLREEYLDYWNASVELTGTGRPVDAILSPCAPFVAPPHGMNKYV